MQKGLLSTVLVLSCVNVWAQGVSDEAVAAAANSFLTGREAVQKGDLATGVPALEKALSLNPEMFVAHYWLGLAYIQQKDSAKAIEHLQAFVKRPDANPSQATHALRNIVQLLLNEKEYAEAVPHLQRLADAEPTNADLRLQLADILFKAKDEAGGEAQLVKVTELDPKRAAPFFHLGKMAYARKDDAVAKQRLDAFVALAPEGALAGQAYFMLGQIARRANDNEAAKGYFTKYLATNPAPGPQVDAVKQFVESPAAPAPAQ
jgi:tetratricopeptide (TPR) repeat protein